jgi:glycosyltransferase involved in cell wall biosynthesis
MNILQVSPYVVEPPKTGGDHRTHGLVKEFPRLGGEVVRYCQGGSPDTYRNLDFRREVPVSPRYVEHRHLCPLHDLAMAPVLFGYPNVLAGSSLRYCAGPLDRLLELADLILARGPWQVRELLGRSDVPVLYSSHNVEVERFESTHPPFYSVIQPRVHELERVAVEETVATICTSRRDAEMYRERFEVDSPLIVAPNGTSEDNIRERTPNSKEAIALRQQYGFEQETPVVLFVGSDYGPNIQAAEHILEIASRLQAQRSNIEFLIVGTVGNSIEPGVSNVTVTGFVDEFEAHFDLADIALNPITTGAGTNIKLFDYFARGLPVVSTPFGIRGIDLEDGTHACIVDLDEFSDTIRQLLESPEKRDRIGEAARTLVADKYTWETISKHLFARLKTLIK